MILPYFVMKNWRLSQLYLRADFDMLSVEERII
jgi:preprotein translocase subunit Sec63